ncbi:MAG: hypothetical protein IPO04_03960 [Cytophagaceae bacterium]|nr:hypothetical protein [Cytophagaceae bacterium]MBL0301750.1 hypothetical protein [Cytophagaceae bacterium]
MKRIFNYSVLKSLTVFTSMAILFGACQKIEVEKVAVCDGLPAVTSATTPTARTITIPGAKLDEWVVLQGSNLCGVSKIMINDVEVDLKEVYITPTEITFKVPKTVPKTINNKIILTTPAGNAEFGFTVYMAPLLAYGYGGQTEGFTPIGQNLVIKTKNLDLYGFTVQNTKVLFGAIEAKPTKVTADEIHVIVPNGAVENTEVTITNGANTKLVAERYKDARGLIFTNDPSKQGWTSMKVSSGPSPAPLSGNYAVVKGLYGDWAWDENFHIADNKPLADYGVKGGDAKKILVKFEVNVPKAWDSNPIRIWYKSPKGTMNYNFPFGGGNFSGTAFKTSGWQTVTIPLSDFIYSEDDAGANKGTNVKTLEDAHLKEWIETRIYLHGGTKQEMEVYWDNFRIVPAPVLE